LNSSFSSTRTAVIATQKAITNVQMLLHTTAHGMLQVGINAFKLHSNKMELITHATVNERSHVPSNLMERLHIKSVKQRPGTLKESMEAYA